MSVRMFRPRTARIAASTRRSRNSPTEPQNLSLVRLWTITGSGATSGTGAVAARATARASRRAARSAASFCSSSVTCSTRVGSKSGLGGRAGRPEDRIPRWAPGAGRTRSPAARTAVGSTASARRPAQRSPPPSRLRRRPGSGLAPRAPPTSHRLLGCTLRRLRPAGSARPPRLHGSPRSRLAAQPTRLRLLVEPTLRARPARPAGAPRRRSGRRLGRVLHRQRSPRPPGAGVSTGYQVAGIGRVAAGWVGSPHPRPGRFRFRVARSRGKSSPCNTRQRPCLHRGQPTAAERHGPARSRSSGGRSVSRARTGSTSATPSPAAARRWSPAPCGRRGSRPAGRPSPPAVVLRASWPIGLGRAPR